VGEKGVVLEERLTEWLGIMRGIGWSLVCERR
jgi:hypothetical protein